MMPTIPMPASRSSRPEGKLIDLAECRQRLDKAQNLPEPVPEPKPAPARPRAVRSHVSRIGIALDWAVSAALLGTILVLMLKII